MAKDVDQHVNGAETNFQKWVFLLIKPF